MQPGTSLPQLKPRHWASNHYRRERMEWIKCSDQMPEVGRSVIGWNGFAIVQVKYCSNTYAKTAKGRLPRFESSRGIWDGCTYWMPLPEPPGE
ncbi:DUF551 domain-containing protein [Pantoea sp. NSTU24]|uniref:DUF551 domain-containing protein n=1 Tax=Pantoea sp. NSTU24 TaxID=3391144 RepID=UPI003D088228